MSMPFCVLFPGEVEAESEEEDDDDDDCKKGSMDEVIVDLIKSSFKLGSDVVPC